MLRSTLLVILIVAPPVVTAAVMRSMETPRRFFEVEPGRLYRSGFPTGDQIRQLHDSQHIRTVISLTSDENKPRDKDMKDAIAELGLHHYRFAMSGNGTTDHIATLDQAADALAEESDGPVLFHCAAGKQRTSVTLGAYWMKHKGKSLDETLKELARDYGLEMNGDDKELVEQLRKYSEYIGDRSKPKALSNEER
jgi:protein tyrosine/serine phosphatase